MARSPNTSCTGWLAAVLLLAIPALCAADDVPLFELTRRAFYYRDGDTDTTSTDPAVRRQQWIEDEFKRGNLKPDPESGRLYAERRATMRLQKQPDGSVIMQRRITGMEDAAPADEQLPDVTIPVTPGLEKSKRLLLANDPWVFLRPEYLTVLGDENPLRNWIQDNSPDPETTTDNWLFRVTYDPETGRPATIMQHDRATGRLLKRVVYTNWRQTGQGLLPATVTVRTFAGDTGQPVVEAEFTLVENTPPATD